MPQWFLALFLLNPGQYVRGRQTCFEASLSHSLPFFPIGVTFHGTTHTISLGLVIP